MKKRIKMIMIKIGKVKRMGLIIDKVLLPIEEIELYLLGKIQLSNIILFINIVYSKGKANTKF
jgi:hypothetical protein